MNTTKKTAAAIIIAATLLAMSLLTGCYKSHIGSAENRAEYDATMLVSVEAHATWEILVDPETRVEYIYHLDKWGYGAVECLTVRLAADGKPMLYEGEL